MAVFSFRLNDIPCLTESFFWHTAYFYIKLKLSFQMPIHSGTQETEMSQLSDSGAEDASTTSSINLVKMMWTHLKKKTTHYIPESEYLRLSYLPRKKNNTCSVLAH